MNQDTVNEPQIAKCFCHSKKIKVATLNIKSRRALNVTQINFNLFEKFFQGD